jgi:AcrR family transcriptional regulator
MPAQQTLRWRRRKQARPAEILAAALACFKERGFAGTRLDDVAAKAGITKGTIYLYYPNKEELFEAVVRLELVPNIERLETIVAKPDSAAEHLKQLFSFWARTVAPSPLSVIPKIIFAEAGNFPKLARFFLETAPHRMLRLITAILRRGIANGEFRPVDVDHVVYCIIGPLVFSLLWQHSLGPYDDKPLDVEAVCRAHLDLVLHGLKVARQTSREPARKGGRR